MSFFVVGTLILCRLFEIIRRFAVLFLGVVALGVTALFSAPVAAQGLNAPLERVTFPSNMTLRGFVDEHLGDPNLWPYVLELNSIPSPADIRIGDVLLLPVQQVKAADAALAQSLATIQKANAEGARVFAPAEINGAIENHDSAVTQREVAKWQETVDFSNIATLLAQEALEIAIAQRDRSAEAIVSDVQGAVEGRAPAEPRWSNRTVNDILIEFERVRTLSASTTQITFRDLSRLRLNANSNATIQRMRSDPITGGEVTKVSLVNGDFYALLNQLSDQTSFEVDIPGVQTETDSSDFWVKNDRSGARFVNYDTAALNVTRGDTSVSLSANEGVVLTGRTAQKAEVLDAVALLSPAEADILYTGNTALEWSGFEGAKAYWLEVAQDPGFNQMQVSEWGIDGTRFEATDLPPRGYHWRVAALDALGLPGQWSAPQTFTVRKDDTPPFLTLLSPGPGQLTDQPEIELLGASEPQAAVLLNGETLELGSDGSFLTSVALVPGENTITLDATDLAGNQSSLTQTVVFRPAKSVEIVIDPQIPRLADAYATRSEDLTLTASTNAAPGAPVNVRDSMGELVVQSRVTDAGLLSVSLPVTDQQASFAIEITSPGGQVEGRQDISAVRDQIPPEIMFDLPAPKAIDESFLELTGSVGDAVRLQVNGEPVPLTNGTFALPLDLVPGPNPFDFVATDAVGNVTVKRVQTVYDIEPPVIRKASASRPQGTSGPIMIEVLAEDASGLRQAAAYILRIGAVEREGFLRCDSAVGVCRATLPPEAGKLSLIEVAIEDYAGNTAFE